MYIVFALLGLISSQLAMASNLPNDLKTQYQSLLEQPLVTNADGSKELGKARLYIRDGIRVLYLTGDRFEMAFQHGRLTADIFQSGAMPQIAKMIEKAAKNSFPDIPSLVDPIINGIYRTYSNSIVKHSAHKMSLLPKEYLVEAYGLAAGSGQPLKTIIHAFLAPEMLQVILGQQMRGVKNLPTPQAVAECTDFAVPATRTENGGFIIGRNTDYSLNGYFDRYPTVLYYNPTDGSQPHMAVTSAGVHTAGVVGYNKSGLFLAVHTIPTWDTSTKGFPVFDVSQHALRHAKTFDEAVTIFQSMPPAAGWAYTLVSSNENRTATIEVSNSRLSVRETTGSIHVQTNHYLSKSMLSRNLDINATINEDTRARFERVFKLLEDTPKGFTVQNAVSILGDKTDPYSDSIKGLGNVVATNFTVTSAVFDTGKKSLYLASGLAPTSLTPFIELPLIENFDPETFTKTPYEYLLDDHYHHSYPNESRAEQLYIQAKHAYEIELNHEKARDILEQITTLDINNPTYLYMLALMQIKTGHFEQAQQTLNDCVNQASGHYRLTCQYFSAKIHGVGGKRDVALNIFNAILLEADPSLEAPLIAATQKNIKTLRRLLPLRLNPDTLAIFMPEADVLAY
jgi:tetratricopeptide (TPR) repeat protein